MMRTDFEIDFDNLFLGKTTNAIGIPDKTKVQWAQTQVLALEKKHRGQWGRYYETKPFCPIWWSYIKAFFAPKICLNERIRFYLAVQLDFCRKRDRLNDAFLDALRNADTPQKKAELMLMKKADGTYFMDDKPLSCDNANPQSMPILTDHILSSPRFCK